MELRNKKLLNKDEYALLLQVLEGARIEKEEGETAPITAIIDRTGYTTYHVLLEDLIESAVEGIEVPEPEYRVKPEFISKEALIDGAGVVMLSVKAPNDTVFTASEVSEVSALSEINCEYDADNQLLKITGMESGKTYKIVGTSKYGTTELEYTVKEMAPASLISIKAYYVYDKTTFEKYVPAEYREQYPDFEKDILKDPWLVIIPTKEGQGKCMITLKFSPDVTFAETCSKVGTISEDGKSLVMELKNYLMFETSTDLNMSGMEAKEIIATTDKEVKTSVEELKASTYSLSSDLAESGTSSEDIACNVTLTGNGEGNINIDDAIIKFKKKSGSGNVTFKMTDSLGSPFEFQNEGEWGPENGFEMAPDYNVTSKVTVNFDAADTYEIEVSVVRKSDESVVLATLSKSITVE